MARLSDLQLAQLLDEVAGSMQAGVPVVDAMARLRKRRSRPLAVAAARIDDALQRGEELPAAVSRLPTPLSSPASVAVEVAGRSGDVDLLKRMSRQLRWRSESGRQLRLGWIYPLLLMVVAYLVAVLVMAPMVRRFEGSGIEWSWAAVMVASWLDSHPLLPAFLIAAAFVAAAVWQITRSRFPRDVRLSLFCEALADQLQHGVTDERAVENAALISGDAELRSMKSHTLDSPQVQRLLRAADNASLESLDEASRLAVRLRETSLWHQRRSLWWDWLWIRTVPRLATVIVGAGMIMIYAWFVLAPIYLQVGR